MQWCFQQLTFFFCFFFSSIIEVLLSSLSEQFAIQVKRYKLEKGQGNEELLRRTQLCNIGTTIRRLRLRWLGHVMRMPGERVARQVLFGQLRGTRPVGSPPVASCGMMCCY
jgi:hypothetical protein